MSVRNRPRTPIFAVAALALAALASSAGCAATSNLQDRPEWAKSAGAEIPGNHPRHAEFPTSKFMTIVTEGTSSTIESARANAEKGALKSFGDQILAQVTSRYESTGNTQLSTRGDDISETSREEVKSSIKVQSEQFLSSVKAISIWDDGFVVDKATGKKTLYVYGAYVLDRDVAGDQARAIARRNIAALESLTDVQLHDQSAKDVLKRTFELELVSTAAQFFGKPVSYPAANQIKRTAQDYILRSGEARVASGDTRALEEALALYEYAAIYDAGGVWTGRALAVRRSLPCLNCNGTGTCVQCLGSKGNRVSCEVCRGSQRILEPDPACDGTGEQKCLVCNGKKVVGQKCSNKSCRDGKEVCPTCHGTRQVAERCNRCSGQRTVRTPQGQLQTCAKCAGQGVLYSRCPPFGGCNGEGLIACRVCGGDQIEEVGCPKCGATGRFGQCRRCHGAGKLETKCRSCADGSKWVACSTCNGSGSCAVCKGRKNRM